VGEVNGSFQWTSLLGVSVILFLAIGALWILIGALTPFFMKNDSPDILFVSQRTDTEYFGGTPQELAPAGSPLAKFRAMLLLVVSGFLLMAGTLVICLAWFGLRQGEAWALGALAVGMVVAISVWALALRPYVRAGVSLGVGDLPPFMWVAAVVVVPAIVLGLAGVINN
jgi:hypothetical protein